MARHPRPQIAHGLYHVTMRGNNREDIFFDDDDRDRFLSGVATVRHRCGWHLHAYCLMTNHYHLLVETPKPNIAVGMQWLNSSYSHQQNRAYERIGHLFQRRYADGLITETEHLRTVLRYIPLNPVKAGLCRRPEDWRWSSYGATLGLRRRPPYLTVRWLLSHFADEPDLARIRYREWVEDGIVESPAEPPGDLETIFKIAKRPSHDAVRRARAGGFSVKDIARHLGVNVRTVQRWLAADP